MKRVIGRFEDRKGIGESLAFFSKVHREFEKLRLRS